MAFPTRHAMGFGGTLTAGQRVTIAHGIRTGTWAPAATGYHIPQVLFRFNGCPNSPPNISIGADQDPDATNIYLSNWDPVNAHVYSVMVRAYHDIDNLNT